jgi:hypothetical protein
MPREPVGLLIIRVWMEQGSPEPFRATIRATADVGSAAPVSLSVAEPDEVVLAVRRFIQQVVRNS